MSETIDYSTISDVIARTDYMKKVTDSVSTYSTILMATHQYTGFRRKGRQRPFRIMQKMTLESGVYILETRNDP
jgi:hypothetical protein